MKKTATLLTAGILLLGACSEENEQSAADATPTEGGELSYALATSPGGLDPNVVPAAVDYRVMRSIYDSLVIQTEDGIEPWLAESWEISDDGTAYTFHLRDDVTFHDGTPFNAEAVQYNFERIKDPKTQ
ncbi:ABC transporter substrate-binding protein [Geomicrobium sp. JCM 19039]|uniref:ABC transporter substrate-binding protein n=1 Tax=Geomicrobium sp. JCM 19039 TaxID=1460636 RepID=UPI00045F3BC3|nr:ABC transporter substrate-binding protein [Geomicrobium sp. JCM 19039]GAK13049.1 dipeptide-binding ABC transporter, periplasmic substrate-binding component [Geomicrobium sp. JCM 19039]